MSYQTILAEQAKKGLFVSQGLDPDINKIPNCKKTGKKRDITIVYDFLIDIVHSTSDIVGAYKPNFAFFEQFGSDGYAALEDIALQIKSINPGVFLIADCKRGDIDNTNEAYMKTLKKFDGFTIAPYLGGEANAPFFADKSKLAFVLCQTSNKGAEELQGLYTMPAGFDPWKRPDDIDSSLAWLQQIQHAMIPLYQRVAKNAIGWSENVGLVTGATFPDNMAKVRQIIGDERFLLIPGYGTQQGALEASLKAGMNSRGEGILLNISRSSLYASKDEDFAEAARNEIVKVNNAIAQFRYAQFGIAVPIS